MTPREFEPWWWLLLALLAVASLTSVLRLWVQSRRHASDPPPAIDAPLDASVDVHVDAPPDAPDAVHHEARLPPMPRALRDPLTGLPSRLLLEDQIASAALRAETNQRRLALLSIDLDGFKAINDSHGHAAGDALLCEVASRLMKLGRSTDTLARLGADEFLLLMEGDPDSASAALVAERIRHNLQRPYRVHGQEVRLSCSIGIVLYPDHGSRARLIARADAARVAAKRAGGNMHCFFDAGMEHDAQDVIDLQRDLRGAIESCIGLELHYQPKFDAVGGQVSGVEALLRWHHPERGMVSPAVFVPVAERFGLIGVLGQWVIEDACRQVRAWQDDGLSLHVAINLSVHQLRQSDLVERVQGSLQRHGVAASQLTFEVTESAAMEDAQACLRLFERLAEVGVRLSIDDFGTGYSSLSYLRKLPASELKIDRSFVQDVDREKDAEAIVSAVIKLAHALGLSVVAEGVETQAQQRILQAMGCDELQGFLFARPMPAHTLQAWVRESGLAVGPRSPAR